MTADHPEEHDTEVREVDRLDEAVRQRWPGRFPESEARLWNRLPIGRKQRAILRLEAVLGLYPPPGSPALYASVKDAAKAAETGVSTFYAIGRRWRQHPSLASLGVHATSDGPGLEPNDKRNELDEFIRAQLVKEPDLTVSDIRKRMGADVPGTSAFATVRRATQRILRELPPRSPFGCEVVFDSAGLDLSDGPETVMRLFALLDVGTGLVLGWDVDLEEDILQGYARAARQAFPQKGIHQRLATRRGLGLSGFDLTGVRACAHPTSFSVHVLPGRASDFALTGADDSVRVWDDKRIGGTLVALIGERVGPIWMGSGVREPGRSFRTGRVDPMPRYSAGINEMIGNWISSHNYARLALMQRDAPPGEAAAVAAEIGTRAVQLFAK